MKTFLETFGSRGIYDVTGKKILHFASDSTTVNSGLKNGLITKMHMNFGEHISFVWCLAHRLELTIKDAFKGSDMTEIECVLNLVYNMYKNSSKKWREIQELFQSMKGDFDFQDNGPTKASGTRWISHYLNALHNFYDKVFVLHMENLIREATTKEKSTLKAGPFLESKGMHAIFQKRVKKGQKRAKCLKIWVKMYKI